MLVPTAWVSSGGASSTRTKGRPAYASRYQQAAEVHDSPSVDRGAAEEGVQREIDAAHERPRVGEQPGRRVGAADPFPPRLHHFGLVAVPQDRVGEHVVRPSRMVRRRPGLHPGAARPGHREERRHGVDAGAGEGIERELGRGSEAPGGGDGAGAPERRAERRPPVRRRSGRAAPVRYGRRSSGDRARGRGPGSRPPDPPPAPGRRRAPRRRSARGLAVLEAEEHHIRAAGRSRRGPRRRSAHR